MKALIILLLLGTAFFLMMIAGCNYELVGPWDVLDPNEGSYAQLRHDTSGEHYPALEGRMQ